MYASAKKIDNLILTIDLNGKQIDGSTDEVLSLGNLKNKFNSFDWIVFELNNGNNIEDILKTFTEAKKEINKGKPICILMKTEMGNGVDFMMNTHAWLVKLQMMNNLKLHSLKIKKL